jgi:hypothetical protein
MKRFLRTSGVLAAVLLSVAGAHAATRVEHAPPPSRAGVVEPAKLGRASSAPAEAPRLVENEFPDPASFGSSSEPPLDGTALDASLTEVKAAEESLLSFPAIDTRIEGPYEDGVAPPDCVLAVGRTTLVALVNVRIEIYSKSGILLQGPLSLASFFGIPPEFGVFDPLAIYDPFFDRFIVAVLARYGAQQDSRIYVAFSQTNDASGAWNRYWIDADAGQAGNWADYGSIGIDRFAVYFTANMFTAGGGFSNATLFVYSKDDGYAGVPLRNTHIIDVLTPSGGNSYRLRPATVPTAVPGDEYYLAHTDSFLGDRINLWRLTGDRFASPSLTSSSVALPGTYGPPPKGRQPGTSTRVDSLGANLWNVVYEQGKLWTAQAIAGSQGAAVWVTRIDVASNPAVREQTYSIEVTGKDTFFPYVIPDTEDDDFAMLSAFSGPDLRPTARYWNVDALGTVRFAELLADSTVNNFSNRHGDYFGIQSDPTDRNRIWMIGQYMKNSFFSGNAAIASVRFEDVAPPSDPPPIPDGKEVLGQPMTVTKAEGGDVTIAWDASACPPAGTHLVWYDLASMASYTVTAETCATGTTGTWTGAPPSGSVAVIVVADDAASVEGSHGRDGTGVERPSQSLACGFASKSTAGTCGP